jgi:hypothetical protein
MKDFEQVESPKDRYQMDGEGINWFYDFNRCYSNGEYVILVRTVNTMWGKVRHACMRNLENTDIPWAIKQEIKNKLFGEERIAIEVFPKESELVDGANMYHLWILPSDFEFPINLTNVI